MNYVLILHCLVNNVAKTQFGVMVVPSCLPCVNEHLRAFVPAECLPHFLFAIVSTTVACTKPHLHIPWGTWVFTLSKVSNPVPFLTDMIAFVASECMHLHTGVSNAKGGRMADVRKRGVGCGDSDQWRMWRSSNVQLWHITHCMPGGFVPSHHLISSVSQNGPSSISHP